MRLIRVGLILFCLGASLMLANAQNPLLTNDSLEVMLKRHPRNDTGRVRILNQLAFGNYYSNPLKSLQCSFEARKLSDSLNYPKGEAESIRQIGLAYWAQGDMTTAITYFFAGLRIARENQFAQEEADLTGNLGTAYNGMGQLNEALSYLHRARKMQHQLKNEWREAAMTNNIGDVYLAKRNFDSARWAYTQAYEISERQNYTLGISTNWRNLGNVLEFEGKFEEALRHYERCVELSATINDARGVILSNKSMASVYRKMRKLEKAETYANRALEKARSSRLKIFIRDAYELLANISDERGNKLQAYDYFKLHIAYKDSIQNLKVISEVNAQRYRYETESKLNEIAILKKEAELQAAEVKAKNTQLFYLILLLVVLFGALGFAGWNYRAIRKSHALLQEKNREIDQQRLELAERRDELTALNEELIAQQDELSTKNVEIESMNLRILESHTNLEKTVQQRTEQLERQNKQLAEYAHFNAHQLRAPVASILGLSTLLLKPATEQEKEELAHHLRKATESLDVIIKAMNATLEEGS